MQFSRDLKFKFYSNYTIHIQGNIPFVNCPVLFVSAWHCGSMVCVHILAAGVKWREMNARNTPTSIFYGVVRITL